MAIIEPPGQQTGHSSRPPLAKVVAGFAAIYIIWGSTYLAIRVAVQTMPPLLMAGARFVLAGCILWLILGRMNRFNATWRQWRDNFVIGAFMLLGGNGLVVWAEREIPSGIATLVISLNPIFVVVAEWLIASAFWQRQVRGSFNASNSSALARPTWLTGLGLVMGLIGLAILVGPDLGPHQTTQLDPWRIGALILACLSWTIGSLANRNIRQPADPFSGAAMQMLGGGVWLLAAGLLFGEQHHFRWSEISPASWLAWVYLLVAGSLVAFTTFIWLMKHCSPTSVSTYAYVNPIVAVFLGWWILDEQVGSRVLLAAATIVAAVALITWSKQQPTNSQLNKASAVHPQSTNVDNDP